jgi:precorrin-2/cobalt-factor-2 C20-methyltransferase
VSSGSVYCVGVGPGDPELVTIKAAAVLGRARVVAHFCKRGKRGNAFATAERYLNPEAEHLPLVYPFTTELSARDPLYIEALSRFYDESAAAVVERLRAGHDVAILCEGDPLFYGSYLHLHERLAPAERCVVIPGITSFAGCAARAGLRLAQGDGVFSVIPGTLPEPELEQRLARGDATAIIKLGRNLGKVKRVLERLGRAQHATYFERGTTASERILPLSAKDDDERVYFSLIIVPPAAPSTP